MYLIQFWPYLPGYRTRSRGLRYFLPPFEIPVASSGCHLCLRSAGHKSAAAHNPFLMFQCSRRATHRNQDNLLLKNIQTEENYRAKHMEKRRGAPRASLDVPLCPNLQEFLTMTAVITPSFSSLMETSSHRHCQFGHWLLTIDCELWLSSLTSPMWWQVLAWNFQPP